ncbi:hypothetical protein MUK51_17890 [Sphingobacterium faecium]|uniref:hypothetical protein n=1 Tax=Sphingobacterium faecium TaxID=34087 RepID=UPI0021B5C0E3|nr:hypothetical protein [Sphingobacterium faecium]UXD69055.1 hypothetical protein MUK51_17890 [Sphingobacterium faecium]
MRIAGLVLGILSLIGMLIAFIPCLGWLNWLNIPFAVVGLIVSLIAYNDVTVQPNNQPKTGIILCAIAIVLGGFRLLVGGGIF